MTTRPLVAWLLLPLVLAAACGSSSSSGSGASGSGGSSKSGASSGSSGAGAGGSSSGAGCFSVQGDGGICLYLGETQSFSCTTPQQQGMCPGSGLIGCCVLVSTMDGVGVTQANCYYDPGTAPAAQEACTGPGHTWQTTPP